MVAYPEYATNILPRNCKYTSPSPKKLRCAWNSGNRMTALVPTALFLPSHSSHFIFNPVQSKTLLCSSTSTSASHTPVQFQAVFDISNRRPQYVFAIADMSGVRLDKWLCKLPCHQVGGNRQVLEQWPGSRSKEILSHVSMRQFTRSQASCARCNLARHPSRVWQTQRYPHIGRHFKTIRSLNVGCERIAIKAFYAFDGQQNQCDRRKHK